MLDPWFIRLSEIPIGKNTNCEIWDSKTGLFKNQPEDFHITYLLLY
jgi:hypothetical protein